MQNKKFNRDVEEVKHYHTHQILREFSIGLKVKPFKSGEWFLNLWNKNEFNQCTSLTLYKDLHRECFGEFIPLLHNVGYKYVIEIDGPRSNEFQIRNLRKDLSYKNSGYKIFRVKAFDENSYNVVLDEILILRSKIDSTNPIITIQKKQIEVIDKIIPVKNNLNEEW